jgi:hypothetical protein
MISVGPVVPYRTTASIFHAAWSNECPPIQRGVKPCDLSRCYAESTSVVDGGCMLGVDAFVITTDELTLALSIVGAAGFGDGRWLGSRRRRRCRRRLGGSRRIVRQGARHVIGRPGCAGAEVALAVALCLPSATAKSAIVVRDADDLLRAADRAQRMRTAGRW